MRRAAPVVLAMAASASCAEPELVVVHDLVSAAPFAELRSAWVDVRPGTLEAELIEERGFERAAGLGAGDLSSLLRSPATLLVALGTPPPQRLVLDVAPEPGYEGHDLEVAVAGTTVAVRRLTPGRQRFTADLPATLKPAGRTRIRLRGTDLPAHARRGPFVARFYGLTAGGAGDPALDALARGRPRAIVAADHAGSAVTQLAPSTLRYALLLPRDAELAFAAEGDSAGPGCGPPNLHVRVENAAGVVRTAWSGAPSGSGTARETRVSLRPESDGPAWVVLDAEAPAGCVATVRWIRPRVLGRSPVPTLRPAPAADTPESIALRRAMGGAGVVLIVLDAARASQLGCYGYPRATTPEIDRLAADGIVFESHYTAATFTYAAMAALWTSRPPDEGGGAWLAEGILPAGVLTLAELLAAQGVRTAGFVANPSAGPAFGLDRGFGEFLRLYREPWTVRAPPSAEVFSGPLRGWLESATLPFFVYAHVREPHMPYAEPLSGPDGPLAAEAKHQGFWDRVNRGERDATATELDHLVRLYDGNLRTADRAVGALRAHLERLGLWDRVAVVVTADHGEALHEHGHVGHNQQVYEESVRVPLVVRLPRGLGRRGVRHRSLTSHLDVAPTVADLLGALGKAGSGRSFHGRSLLPALFADPPPSAVVARTTGDRPVYGLRAGRHKYIFDRTAGREELFDLRNDPGERRDLAPESALLAAVFRQMLGQWLADGRRDAPLVARPAQMDTRDLESLRALGYVH